VSSQLPRLARSPAPAAFAPFALALVGVLTCGDDGATGGVVLAIRSDPSTPWPAKAQVTWLDETRALLSDLAVPVSADAEAGLIGTVRISTHEGQAGRRFAVARGLGADGRVISEGAVDVDLAPGRWVDATVTLTAGRRRDSDGDGVPDDLDGCPHDPGRRARCPGESGGSGGLTGLGGRGGQAGLGGRAGLGEGGQGGSGGAGGLAGAGGAGGLAGAGGAGGGAGRPSGADAGTAVGQGAKGDADVGAGGAAVVVDAAAMGDAPASGPDAPVIDATPAADRPAPPMDAAACRALLTTGQVKDDPADVATRLRLVALGCSVTLKEEATLAEGDLAGSTLVVVSPTVGSSPAYNFLRSAALPLVILDKKALPGLGMSGSSENNDFGETGAQNTVSIVQATHPMAAGLSGTVVITDGTQSLGWGIPTGAAQRVAALTSAANHILAFAFEKGAALSSGTAPARRAVFLAEEQALPKLNANGQKLLDAAIEWALGRR
jgi:hypothetical protein